MSLGDFVAGCTLAVATITMGVVMLDPRFHNPPADPPRPAGNVWVVTNRTGERPLIVVLGTNVKVLCVNYPAIKEVK